MFSSEKATVTLGCEELYHYIKGKKIALMMNTTALDNDGNFLIDAIVKSACAHVECFFGMEHGVRGNLYAGDGNLPDIDDKTGVRIVNLYKYPNFQPPSKWVEKVDAVVFSAQDVGVRHWTYTPWMMQLIETCATVGREVIILDRPNPIRGDIVEGAPAETKYAGTAHLSGFEYPLRHGMTIGELALMYNDLKKLRAKITVLKMHGWKRDMWYDETGLIWVPGSPNMPTTDTPLYFAATGLMQSSNFSLGIGTTTPFQYVGDPDFDGDQLTNELNALHLPGIVFLQKYYMAMTYKNPTETGNRTLVLCNGTFMVIRNRNLWHPVETQLHIMETVNRLFPKTANFEYTSAARYRMCTDEICDALATGASLADVKEKWKRGAKQFEEARRPYLLY